MMEIFGGYLKLQIKKKALSIKSSKSASVELSVKELKKGKVLKLP